MNPDTHEWGYLHAINGQPAASDAPAYRDGYLAGIEALAKRNAA